MADGKPDERPALEVELDRAESPIGSRYVYVAPSTDGTFATVTKKDGSIDPCFYQSYDRDLHLDLKEALGSHIAKFPDVPLAMIELLGESTRNVYAYRPTETHYSASMVKIAAVYAAFALRQSLRRFARARPGTHMLTRAARHFNPQILAASKMSLAPLRNASESVLLPRYNVAFKYENEKIDFRPAFLENLSKAHGNKYAGPLIHGIGYGYINAQLHRATFANTANQEGMWLAGDYLEQKAGAPRRKDKYPSYRVPCVNDHPTAQGASAEAAALMFAMMVTRKAMHGLAATKNGTSNEVVDALKHHNSSWLTRVSPEWANAFRLFSAKPGRGEVGGRIVRSDVSFIRYRAGLGDNKGDKARVFVLAFQNVQIPTGTSEDAYGHRFAKSLLDSLRPYLES